MITKIRELVKKQASKEDWENHISLVVKYSLFLSKKYKIDPEQVELAALLHDIGRLPYSSKKDMGHNEIGAIKAEKILKKYKYPQDKIDEIKQAILCHRGNDEKNKPKTMLDKIIATADAMSHFDSILLFFYWREKGVSYEERKQWVKDKLDRDWRRKMFLPEAKKMLRTKYEAVKLILE